jgi:hypothetical protein
MRFTFTPSDEIRQPFLKLVERIHRPKTRKPRAPSCFEVSVARRLSDSAIGRTIVLECFPHNPRQSITVILGNSNTAMHNGGTQVEQETVELEDAMSFEEGMDHALMGDSSQRPGEHYCVERSVTVVEPLRVTHLITNSSGEPLRQIFARLGDDFGLGIIRGDDSTKLRKTEGEPAVAATDLEHTFAAPIGDAL